MKSVMPLMLASLALYNVDAVVAVKTLKGAVVTETDPEPPHGLKKFTPSGRAKARLMQHPIPGASPGVPPRNTRFSSHPALDGKTKWTYRGEVSGTDGAAHHFKKTTYSGSKAVSHIPT